MKVLFAPTIRHLINEVSKIKINRENIVTLFKEGEQYVLIYCK